MRPRRFAALAVLIVFARAAFAAGTGLTGQYYDTAAFGTLKTTRTDATVNFDWGTAIPSGTTITNGDTFSVAWSGQIEPEFSQNYTFYVTADDGARLWVDDQLLVTRTFAQGAGEMRGQMKLTAGQKVNVRLEYIEDTGSASVRLEWSSASRAREVIPSARLYPARVDKAGGSILKEHWSGIAGASISSLTSSANYPNKPSGRELLTSFECLAQDWADNYGTRVTGYIVAPSTGNFTFAVSGDDVVELYLSTDATAANKALVASASATAFHAWGTPSSARALVQGERYYVELLHKESTGADHWSVGWMKPGDASFSVIPGTALVQAGIERTQPAQSTILDTMAQEHPRIFATAERFAWLRAQWQSGTSSKPKTWAQSAITAADTILGQAPVTYAPDVRGTILTESRTVVDRMYKLGLAWQLTGNSAYAERAWTELNTVSDNTLFPDWHPAHFLDTAEMTHACAIGYDWFYNYWDATRRTTIRTAIVNKGLTPGLSQFTGNAGWSQSSGNNWNMVCNGGLTMGALAVGTESESMAEDILNRAMNSTRPVWKHFTTDAGGWYEGPGYWGYTMEYGHRMLASLEWVLGSDFGITTARNIAESGLTPIHALGTSNVVFNYADAGAGGAQRGPQSLWLARRYGQPIASWWENQGSGSALSALWYAESTTSPQSAGAAPDYAFHGEAGTAFNPQEMVTMRGKWNDSRATFVGTKGGQMGADHGNLDAGTFVLDALGKRWFHDLGGDNYALAGYFSSTPGAGTDRWDYYRMRPEGQNTLTINPSANADMTLNAVAPLIAYQSEPGGASSFAIHDLTPVYSGMTRVWRGVRLLGARNQVLVQDEIQAATGKTVWWFAHYTSPTTSVVIDPDGTSAMLTQGAERLWCKIVSGGGTFQTVTATPLPTSPNPSGQNANTGYMKLAINLAGVTNTTLAVWFVPLSTGENPPVTLPAITALNTWNLSATSDTPVTTGGNASGSGENAVDIDLRAYVTDDSTPPELMRFSVSGAVNGTVVLLSDGYTARFTPTPGYTGVPSFSFTATDTTADSRLVLAYDFDGETSTSSAVPDVSGNLRDGTIDLIGAGTAAYSTDVPAALGRPGRSLDLNEVTGTDVARVSRVVGTGELDFNTSDWTISAWFKRRDTGTEDYIFHIGDGDGFGGQDELYAYGPASSSNLALHHFYGTSLSDINQTANGVAAAGAWHHLAVVRSGGTITWYVDNAVAGTDNAFALAMQQTFPLVFGGHSLTSGSATFMQRYFDGQLDECAVFNAALTPAEVSTLAGGMTVRHFGGLSTTGTITLSATPTMHVWTNTTTGTAMNWGDGANWQGGTAPTSSRGATVQFFNGTTLSGGTISANNNVAAPFQANALTLTGTSGVATTTAITGGTLQLLNNGTALPSVNLSASGTTTTYDVQMPLTLGADTTFNATASGTFIFSGNIDGPGGITRTSTSSKLILTGTNSYTGDTNVSAGTLQIGNDGATGTLGAGDVNVAGTLRFDRMGTLPVPNTIGGTGGLQVDCPFGAGTVVLTGVNTFAGNVNVSSGALRITNSAALGEGTKTITLSNGTAGKPELRLDGSSDPIELANGISFLTSNDNANSGAIINEAGDNILGGDITLTGGGGSTRILVQAGTLTLLGDIAPNTTGRFLKLMGAGAGLHTGNISNGAGPNVLGISKEEAGTWTLAGANSHSGSTTIAAGTLRIGTPTALGHGGMTYGSTATGGTSVSANATLDLNGQNGVNEVLTINGAGVGGSGALVNSSATPANIAGGVVSSITVTNGGSHTVVPNVTIAGGGGSGATVVATIGGLSAANFTINGGSTVYSVAPSVTISGGGGSGATANAVLTGGVVSGITMTASGSGYTSAPTIVFSGGTVTTAGTNPTGTGNATSFVVSGITVTNPGSGYTSAPTVSFDTGTGTTATANLAAVVLGSAATIGGSGDIALNAPLFGSTTLTKAGAGKLTLNAANTHSGSVTVSGGTLAVNGSLASGGTLTVSSGTALSGTGTIAKNTSVSGTLAPGNSAGTITHTGSLTIAASGRVAWELTTNLDSGAGVNFDRVSAAGVTASAGAAINVVLDSPGSAVDFTDAFWTQSRTWTAVSATSVSGTFALGAVSADSTGRNVSGWGAFSIQQTSTAVNVVWTPAAPFQQWQALHFGANWNVPSVAGDLIDFDQDGLKNLLEYTLLNGDPNSVTRGISPVALKSANGRLALTFDRLARADLTLTVRASDAPGGAWETAATSVSGAAFTPAANYQVIEAGTHLEVRDRYLIGDPAHPRRFMRLEVTRP